MRKFLVVLIILVGLLVAADRVGAVVAGREIASRVQTAYNLPSKPSVSVRGFPFLTQLASGNYHEIDVSVPSLSANGVTVDGLTARLTGVRAPLNDLLGHGSSSVRAANVTGSATVPFSSVRSRLPRGVQLSQDGGALRLAGAVTYLGVTVPVSADASLAATGSGIAVTPTRISVASGSSALSSVISGRFRFVIPVTGLPLHLSVNAVTVVPGGVRVSAFAANVAFTTGS
jgi:LmeA-like phospholipid-binding